MVCSGIIVLFHLSLLHSRYLLVELESPDSVIVPPIIIPPMIPEVPKVPPMLNEAETPDYVPMMPMISCPHECKCSAGNPKMGGRTYLPDGYCTARCTEPINGERFCGLGRWYAQSGSIECHGCVDLLGPHACPDVSCRIGDNDDRKQWCSGRIGYQPNFREKCERTGGWFQVDRYKETSEHSRTTFERCDCQCKFRQCSGATGAGVPLGCDTRKFKYYCDRSGGNFTIGSQGKKTCHCPKYKGNQGLPSDDDKLKLVEDNFAAMDKDSNRKISFDELIMYIEEKLRRKTGNDEWRDPHWEKFLGQAKEKFNKRDKNEDGYLDLEEFIAGQ